MILFRDIKCKILDSKVITKDKKMYYIIKVYFNFSDKVYSIFVDKDTFEKFISNYIDDDNILDYLLINIDSKGSLTFAIKKEKE